MARTLGIHSNGAVKAFRYWCPRVVAKLQPWAEISEHLRCLNQFFSNQPVPERHLSCAFCAFLWLVAVAIVVGGNHTEAVLILGGVYEVAD